MFSVQDTVITMPMYLGITVRLMTTERFIFKLRKGKRTVLNNTVI